MWYVYIVRCNDSSLYTGITNDLQKRISKHNEGSASKYTRAKTPVKLLYTEQFPTRSAAQSREAEIKNFSREDNKKLIKFDAGVVQW